jgi:hypothetical protein
VDQSEAIEGAKAAIGKGQPDDYILRPTKHAEELAERAPALVRLLGRSEIENLAAQYERLDHDANTAQVKFKDTVTWANGAVLATGILGAFIMAAGMLEGVLGERLLQVLLIALGICAALSGALASMRLYQVREGSLLETWMTRRAQAESRRLEYFATLVQLKDGDPSDLPLGLLKLEYFRRYQLDVQVAYYGNRGKQHRHSAEKNLEMGGLAAGIAGIVSGSAGLTAAFAAPLASLAAIGVVGTALAAFATAREEVNQDRRNAERYDRTLLALESLRGRLDKVRAGVFKGSQTALNEYVAAVHEQLSVEHREWLAGAESTSSAVGKLDDTLAALQEGGAKPEAAG